METILITGASGFIGSFIVEEALKRKFGVWAGIRSSSSREYLKNILHRDREITRQVLEDIERETVGYISPDAKKDIDKEISKIQK